MATAIDFSKYELNGKYYGGSERKEGISIDGDDYMIKFQKQTAFGKRNNHISEFIGSHIFEICGFNVHKTYLETEKRLSPVEILMRLVSSLYPSMM